MARLVQGRGRRAAAGRGAEALIDPSPAARRMAPARFGDARLWLGIGLLAGSTVIGARVLTADDDTVTVWRASRDLSVGSEATGLEPVTVGRDVAGKRYAGPADTLAGVLRWPVSAGELVPLSALAPDVDQPLRRVTVPVDPLHAPTDMRPGDLVDLWSSPRDSATSDASVGAPVGPVLPHVRVSAVSFDELGLGGEIGVVLAVPQDQVGAAVAAIRSGVVDLVAVPIASQDVVP
jgi:hypothetical protein